MKLNNIYIISWFGKDSALANKRRKIHQAQLDWCAKHNLHPVIFAQEYEESDYVTGPTYIKNTSPVLHPGPARNRLLQHFYQTDDDFAVFADNDGILYEDAQHGDSANYIEIMRQLSVDDFFSIDVINPLNPARAAFNKELATDIYKTHLVYRKTNRVKGTLFFVKNVKKHKQTELYFDEVIFNDNGRMLPGEDTEFGVAALMQGLGCYYTYCAIVNELATTCSTWAVADEHSHIVPTYTSINKKYDCTLYEIPEEIVKTYGHIGYSKDATGEYIFRMAVDAVDRTRVLEKNNNTDVKFYPIPVLPIGEAVQYAIDNIDDPILRKLLDEQIRKNKKFVNRGKSRVKFNWDAVPVTFPLLSDKIFIAKK